MCFSQTVLGNGKRRNTPNLFQEVSRILTLKPDTVKQAYGHHTRALGAAAVDSCCPPGFRGKEQVLGKGG